MFEKAVAMNPKAQLTMGNLADAYRWSGQKQQAAATYDKAIALAYKDLAVNPRDASTMGSLALYYGKKGDVQRGLSFIRRARSIDATDVYLVYSEALLDCLDGRKLDALTTLRQALQQGYPVQEAQNDPELKDIQSMLEFASLVKEFSGKQK